MNFRFVDTELEGLMIICEDDKGNVISEAEKLHLADTDRVELEGFFSELNYLLNT